MSPSNGFETVVAAVTWLLVGLRKPTIPEFISSNQIIPLPSTPIPATNTLPQFEGVPGGVDDPGHRTEAREKS
jgi:hypothetical protein